MSRKEPEDTRHSETAPRPGALPPWLRLRLPAENALDGVRDTLKALNLNTVCMSAQCPNRGECWSHGTATFMILGAVCSRDCAFCGVASGATESPDPDEPDRIAEAVSRLSLRYCVITSVTRDDLPDGGAAQFAAVIRSVRNGCPDTAIEILVPDFGGNQAAIRTVVEAWPDVFGHNVETVARLHTLLRDPRASYARSLDVLRQARAELPATAHVKSGLMVGCGETPEEVLETLADLHEAGCDAVTIGQYLKPRGGRAEIREYVHPEQFALYEKAAYDLGFQFAMAGPLVRSSYHAEALMNQDSGTSTSVRGDNLSLPPSDLA